MNDDVVEIKISEHSEMLKDHGCRLGDLEKSDAKQENKIDNLCDKIDKLITQNNKWFYALVTSMSTLLVKVLFFK